MIGPSVLSFILVRTRGGGTRGSIHTAVCLVQSFVKEHALRVMLVNMRMVCSSHGFILLNIGLDFAKMRLVAHVKSVSLLINLMSCALYMLPPVQPCLHQGLLQLMQWICLL